MNGHQHSFLCVQDWHERGFPLVDVLVISLRAQVVRFIQRALRVEHWVLRQIGQLNALNALMKFPDWGRFGLFLTGPCWLKGLFYYFVDERFVANLLVVMLGFLLQDLFTIGQDSLAVPWNAHTRLTWHYGAMVHMFSAKSFVSHRLTEFI